MSDFLSLPTTMGNTLNKNKLTNEVLINKLQNTLNRLINKYDLNVKTIELLSNELLETLKILGNCTNCKDNTRKWNLDELHKPINKIKKYLTKKGKYIIYRLNNELYIIDFKLNRWILCESCKGKKIEKLTDKCGNEE